jgi:hypothetical protein
MRTLRSNAYAKAILLLVVVAQFESSTLAYPPDNAAVLYYRIFILYQAEDAIKSTLDDYRQGRIERNKEIEEYLGKNDTVIGMALDATRIEGCDWGLDYSRGLEVVLPPQQKVKDVFSLIAAEATLQADLGNFRKALEHCVSLYRMANHLHEGPLTCYLVGAAVTSATNGSVTRFLSEMPPDMEVLTWFRDELAELDKHPFSVHPSLAWQREAGIISMSAERIDSVVQAVFDEGELKERVVERIRTAEPHFYTRNIAYWKSFMDRIQSAFEMPYEAGYEEIQRLGRQPEADFDENPDATLTTFLAPDFLSIRAASMRVQASSNAIRSALGVYLSKVRTGRLPETLSEDVPGDPFSGKPFAYEKADDHFTLRCQVKQAPEKPGVNQYNFKIAK